MWYLPDIRNIDLSPSAWIFVSKCESEELHANIQNAICKNLKLWSAEMFNLHAYYDYLYTFPAEFGIYFKELLSTELTKARRMYIFC